MMIKNPLTSGWTPEWRCTTFADGQTTGLKMKVIDKDLGVGAGGETYVGDNSTSLPVLFRVYRNSVSFENRRA